MCGPPEHRVTGGRKGAVCNHGVDQPALCGQTLHQHVTSLGGARQQHPTRATRRRERRREPLAVVAFRNEVDAEPGPLDLCGGARTDRGDPNGAIGLGEIKSQVEAAGPEMQRVYGLAAELGVPVTIHFQEVNQPGSPGTYNTGLKKFDAMLKAFPKTTFIGHADAFWANVSADYAEDTAYPTGRITPGGVTDRLLTEYPNLLADMSANSSNNFLNRDPEFAAGFLVRHQNKLMFGSDCSCPDGRGTVRCVARETLTALKKLASADVFRKVTWENGTRLLKL